MPKVYLVNTNKTNNPQNEVEMLSEQKVAAYSSPWKYLIHDIGSGDIVYLYSNTRGIIARGIGTGIVEPPDQENGVYKEYYMHLDRFELLATPLTSKKIAAIAKSLTDDDYKILWSQMMITLPYFIGLEMWQQITNDCL